MLIIVYLCLCIIDELSGVNARARAAERRQYEESKKFEGLVQTDWIIRGEG